MEGSVGEERRVSMSKTKVMVSGEGGETVMSKVDPCGVCNKRVKANSILCGV